MQTAELTKTWWGRLLMEVELQLNERIKELASKKKKLITSMKRATRTLAKSRVEKKKTDAELKKLKARKSSLANMSPEQARACVLSEMESVTPGSIYPRDLEREFERIDNPRGHKINEREVLDLASDDEEDYGNPVHHSGIIGDDGGEGSTVPVERVGRKADEESEYVGEEDREGEEVLDLSEQ